MSINQPLHPHHSPTSARQIALGETGRIVVLALFFLINAVVLSNAIQHDPLVGYDAPDHAAYILTLAEGRLPVLDDTVEFFSPPLPYILPALAKYGAEARLDVTAVAKIVQLQNWLISLAVTWLLIRTTQLARPEDWSFSAAALVWLGILPVYYKTLAFVRGEPWVMLFALLIVWDLLRLALRDTAVPRKRDALRIGLWLGLAILSRQWAFLLFPAIGLFLLLLWRQNRGEETADFANFADFNSVGNQVRSRKSRSFPIKPMDKLFVWAGLIMLGTAVLIGGWFYGHLYRQYGALTAFNRSPAAQLSLRNQPPEFYLGTGDGQLFHDPIRPQFANQLWPKFYAELWGDHEAYFLVTGQDKRSGGWLPGWKLEKAPSRTPPPAWLQTNRWQMAPYLGLVNRIALLPTLFLVTAVIGNGRALHTIWRKQANPADWLAALSLFIVLFSAGGYFWFLIQYPMPDKGDTIKATYLLHIFPFTAILAANWMEQWRARHPRLYRATWVMLLLTAVAAAPLWVTKYS
ncbi:MAG TPA: hypothetical protein EYP41_08620 [Anaerolineae bacterium]|nr:hypothetical protein [Anaerolineae bacterium]